MDNNNNSVDNLDIENDPDVELPIRVSEDKESRMTEANSIAGDIIDDEDQIQDNEGSEFREKYSLQPRVVQRSYQPWVVEKFLILLPSPRTFLMNIRSQQFVGIVANLLIQARKGPNIIFTFFKASLSRFYCLEDEYSRYFNV